MSRLIVLLIIVGITICDKNSVEFYLKALQGNLGPGIDFAYNENNKYLKNKEDLTPDKLWANIPRELSFSSCDFFPLRDYFADILFSYYNKYRPNIRYDQFMNRYVLIFNMMFYKRGIFPKAEQYYKSVHPNIIEDDFINFKVAEIKKSYLNNIPLHTYSKPIFSAIYYSDENLNNAERLSFDVTDAKVAIHLFDHIYETINKEKNPLLKVIFINVGAC